MMSNDINHVIPADYPTPERVAMALCENEYLMNEWKRFARKVGVKPFHIVKLKDELDKGTSYLSLFMDILQIADSISSNRCTLQSLISALNGMGYFGIAEQCMQMFNKYPEDTIISDHCNAEAPCIETENIVSTNWLDSGKADSQQEMLGNLKPHADILRYEDEKSDECQDNYELSKQSDLQNELGFPQKEVAIVKNTSNLETLPSAFEKHSAQFFCSGEYFMTKQKLQMIGLTEAQIKKTKCSALLEQFSSAGTGIHTEIDKQGANNEPRQTDDKKYEIATLHNIAEIISTDSTILEEMENFISHLNLPDKDIKHLMNELQMGMKPKVLIFEALEHWYCHQGRKNGTLCKLTDQLTKAGLHNSAENIRARFHMTDEIVKSDITELQSPHIKTSDDKVNKPFYWTLIFCQNYAVWVSVIALMFAMLFYWLQ